MFQEPHLARSKPSSLVKREEDYAKVFAPNTPLAAYYSCAELFLRTQAALRRDLGDDLNRVKSNFRHQIAYVVTASKVSKIRFGPNELSPEVLSGISASDIEEATRWIAQWVELYQRSSRVTLDGVAKSEKFTDFIQLKLDAQMAT